MSDDRRRRFSQIERPRAAGGAEPPDASPGTDARFGALEERPAPAAGPAPGGAPVARGHTDRFRPAADRPLEVDERAGESQPFVRCPRCETDCSRFTARCTTCGAPLDGDEVRAFNERLWAERRAVADAEAAAAQAREAALAAARDEAAAARRALAESMAREVGDQERRRLEGGGLGEEPVFGPPGGGGWGGERWGDDAPSRLPLGLRLLAALPPAWRVPVGVGAVALAALLFLVHTTAGLVAGLALVALVTPGGGRWRRRW